jgi:hypothetical protein
MVSFLRRELAREISGRTDWSQRAHCHKQRS